MNAPKIELGRRVRYHFPYHDQPEGLIVAIRGELKGVQPRSGPFQVIRPDDATFDIVTFDGRLIAGKREHDVGRLGIGCVDLLDKVHGPVLIERAHRLVAEREAREVIERAQADDNYHRNEAARVVDVAPLFYWNGIKDAKGERLQKVWFSEYSGGSVTGRFPAGTIAIYARDYDHFSDLVRKCFVVENDSDIQTDYFDSDRIRVIPSHPLYPQVRAAFEAQEAHRNKRAEKRAGGGR